MSDTKDRGWKYINSDSKDNLDYNSEEEGNWSNENSDGSGSYYSADGGWGYRDSDGSGTYYGADGSWEHHDSDGSSTYYGADGSWGHRDSDGSATYYGADGSWGHRDSDGSGTYYGEDGSWGHRDSDGSSTFYGTDGSWEYRDADENNSYYEEDQDSDYDEEDDDYDEEESDYDDGDDEEDDDTYSGGVGLGTLIGHYMSAHEERKRQKEQEQWEEEQRRIRKRQRRKERVKFYKRHWLAILIFLTLVAGCIFAQYKYSEYQKIKVVGVSSTDLIGKDREYVRRILQNAGFTYIYEMELNDLAISDIEKEDTVSAVTIQGEKNFLANSKFPYDARIEITYHTVKNIPVPVSSKEAKKLNYKELEKKYADAGFVNITTQADYDLITGWITKDGAVESISVNGRTDFEKNAYYRPDAEVIIVYHTFKKNKEE